VARSAVIATDHRFTLFMLSWLAAPVFLAYGSGSQ
jgi:hypothetical protein